MHNRFRYSQKWLPRYFSHLCTFTCGYQRLVIFRIAFDCEIETLSQLSRTVTYVYPHPFNSDDKKILRSLKRIDVSQTSFIKILVSKILELFSPSTRIYSILMKPY